MKKSLFLALLLLAGLQTAWAQKMTVRMTNNETHVYKVPQVAEVTFAEDEVNDRWVDLGLPSGTLWATCNVGADRPEEFGDYFAWGEVTQKSRYDWSTYKYCEGTDKSMTKYCTDSSYGNIDGIPELLLSDDAAYVNWGKDWETPSLEQWYELLYGNYPETYTTIEYVVVNEVFGMKVTSKSNGKSIFLPAAGYMQSVYQPAGLNQAGTYGLYWSRTLYAKTPNSANYMYFYSNQFMFVNGARFNGSSVRPVRLKARPALPVSLIKLSAPFLNLKIGESGLLVATVLPENAANRAVVWQSSDTRVAEVADGTVRGKGKGSCIITCRATDGSNVYAECRVIVGETPHGSLNGREWVDLKLPSQTKWANYNIGAHSPEEYGYYFAWGETTTKDEYNWHNYYFSHDGSSTLMTKYVSSATYGTIDNLTLLERADDAASVLWGASWQMPTADQWRELYDDENTTYEWTSVNGCEGIMFTSIRNGESIFFPAAGYHQEEKAAGFGSSCHYWTRTLNKSNNSKATRFFMNSNVSPQMNSEYGRNYGFPVRAVLAQGIIIPTQYVTNITLSASSLSLQVGKAKAITATVLPANADIQEVTWESSDVNVADVTPSGRVVGVANGTCTITCRATDGSDVFAECLVTVAAGGTDTGTHESVDLGLPSGTLWATCNIGANAPEEYGDYFAWGETTPKGTYAWNTYKWCNGTSNSITKYCFQSNNGYNGYTDTLIELQPEDDAAVANWGEDWQMPSNEQCVELCNRKYTTVTWTTQNGVSGLLVTSLSNGNTIFLPAGGFLADEGGSSAPGIAGNFWSRTLTKNNTGDSWQARGIYFNEEESFYTGMGVRLRGFSVRPVRKM